MQSIAVIGASQKAERYSNKLIRMLAGEPVKIFPVHPAGGEVEGLTCYSHLELLPESPNQISLYINPGLSGQMEAALLKSGAKRVIFNPGSENPQLMQRLSENGIEVLEACSLVLQRTGRLFNE